MFWPFGKMEDDGAYLLFNHGLWNHPGWAFLSAAYRLALPVNEVVKTTLFFASLGILVHSAACVINDMLDRDLDRKVGRS
jgi:4-hydroxybenzoate polyprenyltransferase